MSTPDDELTCKPIDSLSQLQILLENLPSWRTLCKELQPHSKYLIKNSTFVLGDNLKLSDSGPAAFCHYDPDVETAGYQDRKEEKTLPKTLVCHDMANGYHDDCKIDGTGNHDAYTFYNWAGIDIFCYFSHHLITIPPLGWINIGHAHGVKVIGTLITEWAEGQEFLDKVLNSDDEYKNFANALVTIAKTFKFDGWLLNIENKVSKPKTLLEFVKHLHSTLHNELKDPVLIWYDSVTIEGTLNWQNGLNERNKPYFDSCDGIFTNYSWSEDQVRASAEVAGDRLTDLYVGIDVWGRNFFGGGQFNTHEAVEVAYSVGCSLALFAPAWTHEAMTSDADNIIIVPETQSNYEKFLFRDRVLWDSIWPYLNTRVPCKLPFKTSFCRGQGVKRRLYGEVLCPVPWYNLRHMQYQPNSSHGRHRYSMKPISKSRDISHRRQKGIIKENASTSTSQEESVNRLEEKKIVSMPDDVVESGQHPSLKRRIRDVFKQIFKHKPKTEAESTHQEEHEIPKQDQAIYRKPKLSQRTLSLQIQAPKDADNKDEPRKKPSFYRSVGHRSMVWPSVNINLGLADRLLVTRYEITCVPEERDCLEVYFADSFTGGSCLKVNPCDTRVPYPRTVRLFHCDFTCTESLVFCVVSKSLSGSEDQTLNIKLSVENADAERQDINLVGRAIPTDKHVEHLTAAVVYIYPLNNRKDFRSVQNYLLLNEPDFYVPLENSYGWNVRYYKLDLPGARVTTVSCCLGMDHGSKLLGHFGVCSMLENTEEEGTSTLF